MQMQMVPEEAEVADTDNMAHNTMDMAPAAAMLTEAEEARNALRRESLEKRRRQHALSYTDTLDLSELTEQFGIDEHASNFPVFAGARASSSCADDQGVHGEVYYIDTPHPYIDDKDNADSDYHSDIDSSSAVPASACCGCCGAGALSDPSSGEMEPAMNAPHAHVPQQRRGGAGKRRNGRGQGTGKPSRRRRANHKNPHGYHPLQRPHTPMGAHHHGFRAPLPVVKKAPLLPSYFPAAASVAPVLPARAPLLQTPLLPSPFAQPQHGRLGHGSWAQGMALGGQRLHSR